MVPYDRHILALTDDQLEQFVLDWIGRKSKEYVEVVRFSGAGDMGRDVVGFLTKDRHEGSWHNYQCKQYGRSLDPATTILELGKVLYYSFVGEFTPPTAYFLVAPRGVNRNLERLVFNPSEFKKALLDGWDDYCAHKISKGKVIALSDELRALINTYDFSLVHSVSLHSMLVDPFIAPVLAKWFGADPGAPPHGVTPAEVQNSELPYIKQLVNAYGEREGCSYASHVEAADHPSYGPHLKRQRERFFDADAFKRFYRDNTVPEDLDTFEDDIYHGVIDAHEFDYADSLTRVDAVMKQAATIQPSGPLAKHARVTVKQGVCHHFVNEECLKWRR